LYLLLLTFQTFTVASLLCYIFILGLTFATVIDTLTLWQCASECDGCCHCL